MIFKGIDMERNRGIIKQSLMTEKGMPVEIAELVALSDSLVGTAGKKLAEAGSGEGIAEAMEWLAVLAERELSVITSGEGTCLACGPGCSFCCVVNVSVLVPEAVAIARYLRTLPDDFLNSLYERIRRQAEKVRWVDDQERPRLRLPCAFLDERGWCLIHPVRPLLCRSVSSDDSEACKAISNSGEAEVVMNLPQKIVYSLLFTGLAGLLQQYGMDCRSLELNRMVHNLLDRPSMVDNFLGRRRLEFL